jgi:hypothetical protein
VTGEVIAAAIGGVLSAAPWTVCVAAPHGRLDRALLAALEVMPAARLAAPKGVE